MYLKQGGDEMKKIYVPPELEIEMFSGTDIITTSDPVTLTNITDPTDPALDDYETLPMK